VELANVSNVCGKWRKIVADSILEVARNSLNDHEDDERRNLLLLPSMVRFVMCNEKKTDNEIETYCLAWFTPTGIRFKQLSIDPQDDSDDEEDQPGYDRLQTEKNLDLPREFAPGGEHLYAGSEDESKKKKNRKPSGRLPLLNSLKATNLQQTTDDQSFVNCLYQWDGLRDPQEILRPFGYSASFVEVCVQMIRGWSTKYLIPLSSHFLHRL